MSTVDGNEKDAYAGRRHLRQPKGPLGPVGLFVLIVGPDGSGKSTLARRVVAAERDDGRRARHMHWRPGLLPQRATFSRKDPDPSRPHGAQSYGWILSLLRLGYYWFDFLLGLPMRVAWIRARGGIVVMERGWWDFGVDPLRYRLKPVRGLVEGMGRLLLRPDLVLFLEAEPNVLTQRKQELPPDELVRQTRLWREISLPATVSRAYLDASRTEEDVAEQAIGRIHELLAEKARLEAPGQGKRSLHDVAPEQNPDG